MKTKSLSIIILVGLFVLALVSCGKVIDVQIKAFEKSIDKLEEKYKDFTPDELQKAIDVCEKQLELLDDKKQDCTKEQQKKIANLTGRYHRLLLKIELYTAVNELFNTTEGESVLEYIRGLLLGDSVNDILQ